jgi:hypothetical protein
MRPASGVRNFPGVVFLKYGGGIFENIPEKCGIFVICRISSTNASHYDMEII